MTPLEYVCHTGPEELLNLEASLGLAKGGELGEKPRYLSANSRQHCSSPRQELSDVTEVGVDSRARIPVPRDGGWLRRLAADGAGGASVQTESFCDPHHPIFYTTEGLDWEMLKSQFPTLTLSAP